ncbi:glycosyltransferase [Ekhidna sp.]
MEKNILVITYWSFKDALIQTYTLPYVEIIKKQLHPNAKIHLVTLDPEVTIEESETFSHVSFKYHRFGIKAIFGHFFNLIRLLFLIRKAKIDVIHTWCTPAGGLGYLLSKLTRKELVIDSFEPHAEPMVESGTWAANGLAFKILFWMEKMQSKNAQAAIACVPEMEKYAVDKYSKCPAKFFVKPACVDLDLFSIKKKEIDILKKRYNLEKEIICVYAGKFGGSYLTSEVFDFFKVANDYWDGDFKALLLNNHPSEQIKAWCDEAGFDHTKVIHEFVPHHEVPNFIGLADFAITPFIPVPSKRYGSPIKTGEYWAMGLPVVITKGISDNSGIIKKEGIGAVLDDLNTKSYQDAVMKIDSLMKLSADSRRDKIREVARRYRDFSIAEKVYQQLYRS